MTTSHVDPATFAYSIIEEEATQNCTGRWLQKQIDNRLLEPDANPECLTATDLGKIALKKPTPPQVRDHTQTCKVCRAILNLWNGYVRQRANKGV